MELTFFLPLLIAMGAMMFFSSRRQRKMMQATIDLHESLRVGDKVQTTSGLYATITGITDGDVDLEIAPGVVTRWTKLAIRTRVEPELPELDENATHAGPGARVADVADGDVDRLPRD